MRKKSIRDIELAGKRVLVRVDYNVPLSEAGGITDNSRIRETLPTLRYLQKAGCRIALVSHLGRPDGKADPRLSLAPVAEELAALLEQPVLFAADTIGADAHSKTANLSPGSVVLLENVRFYPGEEANDPGFAAELAKLGEVFVNDAFGTAHRAHASTAGVAALLPAVAGFLMEKEIDALIRPIHISFDA
jgi:3-phosphoglycerate kinase